MENSLVQGKEHHGIPAVNFHLWQPCNMRCKFCFARFEEVKDYLKRNKEVNKSHSIEIIKQAKKAGIRKLTFAGGEPLLCPWLPELLRLTKEIGITTMIVSNGALLDKRWLQDNGEFVDWFTLSVDCLSWETNLKAGRAIGGQTPLSCCRYFDLAIMIKSHGVKLKINTTVSRYNWRENLVDFIGTVQPVRWKIFQVLRIDGQNDSDFDRVRICSDEFDAFVKRHQTLRSKCRMVVEDNEAMTSSYLMIDPTGRFYDNELGRHRYSDPIWRVGWERAQRQVAFSTEKFLDRDGLYEW